MAWTIEAALDNPLISQKLKFLSEYRFQLGGLSPAITIRIYKQINGDKYFFNQSHFIKTPTQIGPYRTDRQFEDSEEYALSRAVYSLTQYYEEAVRIGNKPDESWLVANESFF